MFQELQDFIKTLPSDVRKRLTPDMKIRKIVAILSEEDIEMPPDVEKAINDYHGATLQHDYIMDSMRVFMNNSWMIQLVFP